MLHIAPLLIASVLSADVTIQQAVPDRTIAFVSTSNLSKIVESVKSAGVCGQVMKVVCSMGEEGEVSVCGISEMQCEEMFDQLGIEKEDWSPPSGYAGAALYPVVDYETSSVGVAGLAIIELDEKLYGAFFDDLISDYQNHPLASWDEAKAEIVSLVGRDVLMMQFEMPTYDAPGMGLDLASFERLYVAYSDGYLLLGSETGGIASALLAIDGAPEENMLETNDDYVELRSRCGGTGDAFAGVLLTNLADTFMQNAELNMAVMLMPSLKTLFGDIDGIAESVTFAPDDGVIIEGTYSLLMNDGRNGLIGLLGDNVSPNPLPSFVGEDTLTYSQGVVEIDKLVPLIHETIAGQPMLSMQFGPQIEPMEAALRKLLEPLGTECHTLSTGSLPIDEDTVGTLSAIECIDEKAMTEILSENMPLMGAEPTDFLGNQIYTIDFGAGMPIPMSISMEYSIAVGGGYVFVGSSNNVENALRAIANPKENRASPANNMALSQLGIVKSASWGYGDIAKYLEVKMAMEKATIDKMLAEMESFDPLMAEEMREEFTQESDLSDVLRIVTSYMGQMAWNVQSDDNGLTCHVTMLSPSVQN